MQHQLFLFVSNLYFFSIYFIFTFCCEFAWLLTIISCSCDGWEAGICNYCRSKLIEKYMKIHNLIYISPFLFLVLVLMHMHLHVHKKKSLVRVKSYSKLLIKKTFIQIKFLMKWMSLFSSYLLTQAIFPNSNLSKLPYRKICNTFFPFIWPWLHIQTFQCNLFSTLGILIKESIVYWNEVHFLFHYILISRSESVKSLI